MFLGLPIYLSVRALSPGYHRCLTLTLLHLVKASLAFQNFLLGEVMSVSSVLVRHEASDISVCGHGGGSSISWVHICVFSGDFSFLNGTFSLFSFLTNNACSRNDGTTTI